MTTNNVRKMTLEIRGVVESDVIGVTSSDDLKRRVDILKTIFLTETLFNLERKFKGIESLHH